MVDESDDIAGERRVFVSPFSRGLSEAPKPRMSGRMVRAPAARSARARPAFRWRAGKRRRSSKGLAEHRLPLFQSWEDALELTELTQSVDPEPMEQDHSGAVSFVVVGDACSVKGRECVHMVSQTLVLGFGSGSE